MKLFAITTFALGVLFTAAPQANAKGYDPHPEFVGYSVSGSMGERVSTDRKTHKHRSGGNSGQILALTPAHGFQTFSYD